MAVRTIRAAGPTPIGLSHTLLYTVPAGRTFRGLLQVASEGNSAAQVTVAINGTGVGDNVYHNVIGAEDSVVTTLIANPGDEIFVRCNLANAASAVLWGSLLLGAPE